MAARLPSESPRPLHPIFPQLQSVVLEKGSLHDPCSEWEDLPEFVKQRGLFSRPIGAMASLKEITRMVLQVFHIVITKGKNILKTVGIRQASVFLLHNPNAQNSMNETGTYHQYLVEP
jgi:hypothetical protein